MTDKFRFVPEDFFGVELCKTTAAVMHFVCNKSNAKLESHLATCPVVFGYKNQREGWTMTEDSLASIDTHRAILFDLESLEKTVCDHNPCLLHDKANDDKVFKDREWVCDKCRTKLKVTWKAKGE